MNNASTKRILSSTLLSACVLMLVRPAPNSTAKAAADPAVRTSVRVGMWTLWRDREVKLIPASPSHKTTLQTCGGCAALTFADAVVVRANEDSVVIGGGGKSGPASRVDINAPVTLAAHGETVTLHNSVEITAHAGVLAIAVTMPVESYVERVVASESGPADTPESLKALAVVVRSFALHENHGHTAFDLCDSTHCQLLHWGAIGDRAHAAHTAALSTAGETLWYRGQRALAYFNKDCGGHTASPAEIWPRAHAVGYLPSQTDRFCTANAGRDWASQITRADVTAALAAHGIARPGWQRLVVARRSESGRVATLRLDASEINAEDFRRAVGQSLGWNQLPSTWFEVNQQGDRFFFHGRGWGHGIGLCQKGAAAMAAQNQTAAEILAQYFPGAKSADENTGRGWLTFARNGFVLESLDAADAAWLPDLDRARAAAMQRSGLNMPQPITVRAFMSTPAFRNATGAPGWVAAFTEGDWIGTQPLRTLASRHLLDSTMRHELLHALVEQQAGPAAPLWLREGLVELWDEPEAKTSVVPEIRIGALDSKLTHATSEADSAAAHRAAAFYASQLVTLYSRDSVLTWLRSGIPANVVSTLGQR